MEDSIVKDQSSASGSRSTSRLVRYPLRSATKSKEGKPPLADVSNSASAVKRGRAASSVSKSTSVLNLSGKEKPSKPPRRLSIPSASKTSPGPKSLGNMTPISEAKTKRTPSNQGKSGTPLSDMSKSSTRKKFSVMSSASYWLTQIRLSEFATKHSISLGFFKLAFEAGCEPIQRMSDELKSYVHRYNLSDLGELIKELFEKYKISDNIEQSQVTVTCSEVAPKGNELSDDDVHSSFSSVTDAGKLNPKLLDIKTEETYHIKKVNTFTTQKNDSGIKTRRSVAKNNTSSKSGTDVKGRSAQKKPEKPIKIEAASTKDKLKKQAKKSSAQGEGPVESQPKEALQENKENMAAPETEVMTLAAL